MIFQMIKKTSVIMNQWPQEKVNFVPVACKKRLRNPLRYVPTEGRFGKWPAFACIDSGAKLSCGN